MFFNKYFYKSIFDSQVGLYNPTVLKEKKGKNYI